MIIDWGISAPGNGEEVLDGLNDVDKRYIYQLMSTFQLPGSKIFDSQIQMHTDTQKYDVSLAKGFQEHLTKKAPQRWFHWSRKIQKTIHGNKMDIKTVSCSA